ncbi:catechol 2,3-dioxygenase-like lactoylglutathione lyase family enzyme [Actinoalloteichus hymeniacidonis]|uniref:Glyoxalase-like domain n=2 Tax=Actinoalloteichus hymeniacidonis TaxID=340345 RepID=A0AAC9HWQ0_9PSEU|nr:Glyoxalase-like domain [Actinoalloteichus hymeniacidonis]MBB5906036.1 catechol 2,3-dioxygenase-like lactoylglutathione lyase family enzyme [Actinoalloteichus hymeniacidonis]
MPDERGLWSPALLGNAVEGDESMIDHGAPTPRRSLRLEAVVLDCPDPAGLAAFYGAVLGWETVAEDSGADWVRLRNPAGSSDLCFQRDPEYLPPDWPGRARPQMLHLDIEVADVVTEHERVSALGARLLAADSATFRVYADPAGHPFCLCACPADPS